MWKEIKETLLNLLQLPLLIIGYAILLLFSLVIPPKYSMRLYSVAKIEEKIGIIINHQRNLIIFSLILTLIVYITYRAVS